MSQDVFLWGKISDSPMCLWDEAKSGRWKGVSNLMTWGGDVTSPEIQKLPTLFSGFEKFKLWKDLWIYCALVVSKLRASVVVQLVKNPLPMQHTWVWSPGQEDPLEKEMATHSSILAWRIPWTDEPGGLQSVGSQGVRHDWATKQNNKLKEVWLSWGSS